MSFELILAAPEAPSWTPTEVPVSPPTVDPSSVWQMPGSPPIVVQNLPADGGWTSQSWATIIAACIALAAALLALFGVLYTQRVSRATAKAQLRQQRAAMIRQERQHTKQLAEQARQHEASLREQRDSQARDMQVAKAQQIQNARLNAVIEAADAIKHYRVKVGTFRSSNPSKLDPSNNPFDAITRCTTARLRLQLVGLPKSARAFRTAEISINKFVTAPRDEETDNDALTKAMNDAEAKALATFESELLTTELDMPLHSLPSRVS